MQYATYEKHTIATEIFIKIAIGTIFSHFPLLISN